MYKENTDYGYGRFCPWPKESFEYGGLCSHNALMERPHGDPFTSAEDLEAIAAARKAYRREYLQWRAPARVLENMRENKRRYVADLRENHSELYKERKRVERINAKPGIEAREQRSLAEKKYACDPCGFVARNACVLVKHLERDRHKRVLAGPVIHRCEACDLEFEWPSFLAEHQKLQKHIKAQALFDGIKPTDKVLCAEELVLKDRRRGYNAKHKPTTKANQKHAVENKLHYCAPCKVSCRDRASLKIHNSKPKHHRKVLMGDKDFVCEPCDKTYKYKSDFTYHCGLKTCIAKTHAAKTLAAAMS